jgi:rare lipoprotein A
VGKKFILLMAMLCVACTTEAHKTAVVDPPKPIAVPTQQGQASYYGPHENGRRTASGVIFHSSQMTAASRTLPFGTKVHVTNLSNGDTVDVEINDRGPALWTGRMLDLSQGAAKNLGMTQAGVVPISLQIIP